MTRDTRELLEGIAVDMTTGTRSEAWERVRAMSDAELVAWICDR